MKKGFTILELLVASLLLGMLITILTMIFNQSSIAWRTGNAIVADLDGIRNKVAETREIADSAYIWEGQLQRTTSLWDKDGSLKDRAWDVGNAASEYFQVGLSQFNKTDNLDNFNLIPVGSGSSGTLRTYTINVKSAGPDKLFGGEHGYDDIWSNIDDFEL